MPRQRRGFRGLGLFDVMTFEDFMNEIQHSSQYMEVRYQLSKTGSSVTRSNGGYERTLPPQKSSRYHQLYHTHKNNIVQSWVVTVWSSLPSLPLYRWGGCSIFQFFCHNYKSSSSKAVLKDGSTLRRCRVDDSAPWSFKSFWLCLYYHYPPVQSTQNVTMTWPDCELRCPHRGPQNDEGEQRSGGRSLHVPEVLPTLASCELRVVAPPCMGWSPRGCPGDGGYGRVDVEYHVAGWTLRWLTGCELVEK